MERNAYGREGQGPRRAGQEPEPAALRQGEARDQGALQAYKAWLKADDGGEITYDDVFKTLLDNSAAAEWGTTHPQAAHDVAHAQSLLIRVRSDLVALADQIEVAEAEAEEKVRKQLDALSETVSAQKRELEGEDGKPGLRKRAAERDALAAELEEARAGLADAQEAAASSSAAAEEARAAEDGAKAQLSEIQAENRTLVERAMSAEAQLAEQANQHKIEMLTAKADADRAHADAVARERAAAQDALDALRERMDADAAAERRKAEDALDALRGELTSAKEAAASAESARQAAEGRANRLETELAGEREDRIGAQRDLALLQREHAATEAQLARAQAEVEELKKRPAEVSNG